MSSEESVDQQYVPFASASAWSGLVIDEYTWRHWLSRLPELRAAAPQVDVGELIERAMRVAAIETGAIEGLYASDPGFTMRAVTFGAEWALEVEREQGPEVRALVVAQRAALDLALDAATGAAQVSEAWLRRVQEVVCAAQDTYQVLTATGWQQQALPKGQYKEHPNHVRLRDGSIHAYAPVDRTADEMHRLVLELRSDAFAALHPVVQAAYAHHACVAVHPFTDGNGRTTRVLASVYLLCAVSIPFVMYSYQRLEYFDALAKADRGDFQPLVNFIYECTNYAFGKITMVLFGSAGAEESEGYLSNVEMAHLLSAHDVDALAQRVLHAARAALEARIRGVEPGVEVRLRVAVEEGRPQPGPGWMAEAPAVRLPTSAPTALVLDVALDGRRPVRTVLPVSILQRADGLQALRLSAPGVEPLDFRLNSAYPGLSPEIESMVGTWAGWVLRRALAQAADADCVEPAVAAGRASRP